jgi:hypothetical protein
MSACNVFDTHDMQAVETFVRGRPSTYRAIQVICEESRVRQNEFGIRVREELVLRVATGKPTLEAAMKYALNN